MKMWSSVIATCQDIIYHVYYHRSSIHLLVWSVGGHRAWVWTNNATPQLKLEKPTDFLRVIYPGRDSVHCVIYLLQRKPRVRSGTMVLKSGWWAAIDCPLHFRGVWQQFSKRCGQVLVSWRIVEFPLVKRLAQSSTLHWFTSRLPAKPHRKVSTLTSKSGRKGTTRSIRYEGHKLM